MLAAAYAAAVGGVAPPGGYPQSNPYPSTSAPYPPQPNAAPYPPEQTAPYSSQPQPQPGVGGYAPPSYQPKGGAYPSQAYTPYVQQETNVAVSATYADNSDYYYSSVHFIQCSLFIVFANERSE